MTTFFMLLALGGGIAGVLLVFAVAFTPGKPSRRRLQFADFCWWMGAFGGLLLAQSWPEVAWACRAYAIVLAVCSLGLLLLTRKAERDGLLR